MCLTDTMFLQTQVAFCEYLVFHEFRRNLYITLSKYLDQEGIADLLFFNLFIHSLLKHWSSVKSVTPIDTSLLLLDRVIRVLTSSLTDQYFNTFLLFHQDFNLHSDPMIGIGAISSGFWPTILLITTLTSCVTIWSELSDTFCPFDQGLAVVTSAFCLFNLTFTYFLTVRLRLLTTFWPFD